MRRARYASRIKAFLTSRDDMATVVTRSLYRAQRVECVQCDAGDKKFY